MRTKRSQSVFRVLYAFGTETSSRANWKLGSMKMEWSTFIIAKILKNHVKKCWQNLLKVCFECSVPSVQKPLFAGTWSSEAWKWNGQHLLLPKFWRMIWRNADKTVPKPLAQKRILAEIGSSEAWKWIGQHLFLPNCWRMIWRNAEKTDSKCASSALCLR